MAKARFISGFGFHPSKEGFKVPIIRTRPKYIPRFHPSKEGFKGRIAVIMITDLFGFHPSKEGFKVFSLILWNSKTSGFHPSKEGFKAVEPHGAEQMQFRVSIPLRKVSRGVREELHVYPNVQFPSL